MFFGGGTWGSPSTRHFQLLGGWSPNLTGPLPVTHQDEIWQKHGGDCLELLGSKKYTKTIKNLHLTGFFILIPLLCSDFVLLEKMKTTKHTKKNPPICGTTSELEANWQLSPRYCLRTLFTELFKVLLLQPRGPRGPDGRFNRACAGEVLHAKDLP